MSNIEIFYLVNLEKWVYGTIAKVQQGEDWGQAWCRTGRALGVAESSAKKSCPMTAARTLYELGRIKDSGVQFKNLSHREIYDEHSKNGVYAILALEVVARDPDISLSDLWRRIKILFKNKFVEEPAESNQGGPDIAFKLWKLGLLVTG